MKLVLLLCLVACAVALDPATLLAIAAKSKAANEVAGGVSDILDNLSNVVGNEREDIAQKAAQNSQNAGILLDILQQIQNGQIQLGKRELIPDRDEILERLARLYDRVRAFVNGGADAGVAAYEEALDQIRTTYERFRNFKSLAWLKRWIEVAIKKIEEKLDEYEKERSISAEKREVLPSHEEVVAKIDALYEKIRTFVNPRADDVLNTYKALLDQAREAYERVERFKSLNWLKKWVVTILNKLDEKLQEYAQSLGDAEAAEEIDVERRELIPSREELLVRLTKLYDRFRAYVNAGAVTAVDAYGEGLDYIRYLIERLDRIKSLNWMKRWIIVLIDRAERRLEEYERSRDGGDSVERREVLPPKEEVLAKIAELYERLRFFVNGKSDTALDMFKGTLDEIRAMYERIERIRSLNWLKSWAVDAINALEGKLDEWEQRVEKQSKRDIKDDLLHKFAAMREKLRKMADSGADEAVRVFSLVLDRLESAYNSVLENGRVDWLVKKIEKATNSLYDRIEDKMYDFIFMPPSAFHLFSK